MPWVKGVFFFPLCSARSPPACLSERKHPTHGQTIHQLEPTSQNAFTHCPSFSTCSCCLTDTTWPQSLFLHYSRASHLPHNFRQVNHCPQKIVTTPAVWGHHGCNVHPRLAVQGQSMQFTGTKDSSGGKGPQDISRPTSCSVVTCHHVVHCFWPSVLWSKISRCLAWKYFSWKRGAIMFAVPSNFRFGKLATTLLDFTSVFHDMTLSPQQFPPFKWFSFCISPRHLSFVSPILVILVIWSPLFPQENIGEGITAETRASCYRNCLSWWHMGKNLLHLQNNLPTSHNRWYPPTSLLPFHRKIRKWQISAVPWEGSVVWKQSLQWKL